MPISPGTSVTFHSLRLPLPVRAQRHFQVTGAPPVKLRAVLSEEGKAGGTFVEEMTITLDQRGVTVNLIT